MIIIHESSSEREREEEEEEEEKVGDGFGVEWWRGNDVELACFFLVCAFRIRVQSGARLM